MTALATRSPVSTRGGRFQLTLAAPKNRAAPIVAAIDGSSASRHAIDAAVRLAVELERRAHVRVRPPRAAGLPRNAGLSSAATAKMALERELVGGRSQ